MQDSEEEKYVRGKGNVLSGEIAFPFPTWGNLHYSCLGQFCTRTVGMKKVELFLHLKILIRKISRLQRSLWKCVSTLPATGVSLGCYEPGNTFALTIECLVNFNFLFPMLV